MGLPFPKWSMLQEGGLKKAAFSMSEACSRFILHSSTQPKPKRSQWANDANMETNRS
jgi:hypothetical protein